MDNIQLFFTIFNLSNQNSNLDSLMIFGATYLIFLTFVLQGILFVGGEAQEKKALVLSILAFVISQVIIQIIRIYYFEPRPFVTFPISPLVDHPNEASFPSNHTTTMAAIAFSYYFYKSKYALLFLLFTLWVGFARVFVGVHFPIDILGGLIIGLVSVKLAWIFKNFFKHQILKT